MKKIILSGILFVIALIAPIEQKWITNLMYIISYFIVGIEIIKEAIINILNKKIFDETFLMSIATIGAIIIGEYPEAVAVMIFYQIGEMLQDYAVDKSKRAITEVMNIRPDYANVKRDGKTIKLKYISGNGEKKMIYLDAFYNQENEEKLLHVHVF